MTRHVLRANLPPPPPHDDGGSKVHAIVQLHEVLSGNLPETGVVVVTPTEGDPATFDEAALTQLAVRHDGAENLIVVETHAQLTRGQVGAIAGLGRPWAASVTALRDAIADSPESEAELRWLLWNDGAFVVGAPPATAVGQERRPTATALALLADRIPLPECRGPEIREAGVPSISWVLHSPGNLQVLSTLPANSQRPSEILLVTDNEAIPTSGRIRRVTTIDAGVAQSRGAIIAFVSGDEPPDREAYARVLRRFDDPRVELVQVGYRTHQGVTRSERGLLLADAELGAPAFAAARRRVLRKARGPLLSLWTDAVDREEGRIVHAPTVSVDVNAPPAPIPSVSTLRGLSVTELRSSLTRHRSEGSTRTHEHGSIADIPSVGWVGFSGNDNFGDEIVLRAGQLLLDGLDVRPGREGTVGTVLGGGTLLNTKRFYQRQADAIDLPGLNHLVLGTGVVSPDVAGWTEELTGWSAFLDAGPVGLRGPDSVAHLRAWGHRGEAYVLGDPALVIERPDVARDDRLLLAPVGRSAVGDIDDAWENAQVDLLLRVARSWRAEGHEIGLFCAHPGDDRVAISVLRALGDADVPVVHAYRDLDTGIAALAKAALVLGARLHALVVAAAVGTPFAGIAYLPKVQDFAASVTALDLVAPLDSLDAARLTAMAQRAMSTESREAVAATVATLRGRLRTAGRDFVKLAGADRPTT